MMTTNDDQAVTEIVTRISRDAQARKALADALASSDPARLQRAIRNACGLELSTEAAARLISKDRLVSATLHLYMI